MKSTNWLKLFPPLIIKFQASFITYFTILTIVIIVKLQAGFITNVFPQRLLSSFVPSKINWFCSSDFFQEICSSIPNKIENQCNRLHMDEFSEKAWLVCKTVDIVDTNVNLHLSQQLTLVRGGGEKISSIVFPLWVSTLKCRSPQWGILIGNFWN